MSDGLLTAGSGHRWETDLVAALDRPGAPFVVLRRCADLADVLAMASTGQAAAAIVSSDLRRLDTEAIRRIASLGIGLVAVHPAADQRAAARLARIGITVAIPDDAGSAAILDALVGLVHPDGAGSDQGSHVPAPSPLSPNPDPAGPVLPDPVVSDPTVALGPGRSVPDRRPSGTADRPGSGTAGPPDRLGSSAGRSTLGDGSPAGPTGTVIAVWGPTGAPGRSTVAMGIAEEAAAAGRTVILIDADVYGGVLAAAFGLLDESPGLAGACRLASNGRLDGPTLAGMCWSLGPRWSLLTGIARADRWPEVRPSAVPSVLAVAGSLADVVVVDCAAILETDEEISFDTLAPRRNGATLAVLEAADMVVAVGAGDPPGIERLVRGLAQLGDAIPGVSPKVVVNRTRRSAASRREIEDAVLRFAGLPVVGQLPEDRDATDKAWRRCVGLAQAAPRSALRAALAAFTRTLVPGNGPEPSSVPVPADHGSARRRPGRHSGSGLG